MLPIKFSLCLLLLIWYNSPLIKEEKLQHNVWQETELHVTTPNEPGIMGRVLGTLANAGVNLKALCAYSEGKKGVFYLITSDNKKAEKSLKALGYKVENHQVVIVKIDDRIGAGAEIGALLGNAAIDIEYCYATSVGAGQALLILKTNNNQKAIETLS